MLRRQDYSGLETPGTAPPRWRLVLLAGVLAIAMPTLVEISPAFDLGGAAYFLLIAPCIALVMLVIALRRRTLTTCLTFTLFSLLTWVCFKDNYALRAHGRWLWMARTSKALVLAQPRSLTGELRHVEWDGWGFAGVGNTNVYLVYDPEDLIGTALKQKQPRRVKGVLCEFDKGYRLERSWYALVFYTDQGWGECPPQ